MTDRLEVHRDALEQLREFLLLAIGSDGPIHSYSEEHSRNCCFEERAVCGAEGVGNFCSEAARWLTRIDALLATPAPEPACSTCYGNPKYLHRIEKPNGFAVWRPCPDCASKPETAQ